MRIGLIGLGKMGANLAMNFKDHNHDVLGYDLSKEACNSLAEQGIHIAENEDQLIQALDKPRVIWLMLPCGNPTDSTIRMLSEKLEDGDIVIDGGNSRYTDSIQHAKVLEKNNIRFLDCGTSGGVSGARNGACLMIGGDQSAFDHLKGVFEDISIEDGMIYTGEAGSGHFMKMVHNGIEYGMMQAIGEGFQLMKESGYDYDLVEVAKNWNHGSVIRGWLMEIVQNQLEQDADLSDVVGEVDASGEAKWTIETALEKNISMPVIALSLMARSASKDHEKFACKMVAVMRNVFVGHNVMKKEIGDKVE